MAGETILIVDDAPVNLKLTDILLRKEGYTVETAADAEEAIKMLRSCSPDLILVDIQMPGMDGLELTRRLKSSPLTRNIVVVALTACAMKEDEQKAIAAGCNGYITKPIDTHTLGKRVRRHLDERRAPEPLAECPPVRQPREYPELMFANHELERLQRSFLEDGTLETGQMLENIGQRLDAAKAAQTLHRWAGSAGILGYSAISELADRAEDLVKADKPDPSRLRQLLSQLAAVFAERSRALPGPLPDFIIKGLAEKPIALVGFAREEGDRLCAALERAGARPRLFDIPGLPESGAILNCCALVFHVRPETMDAWCLDPGPPAHSSIPLILAGGRNQILAVNRRVQARANEFLIDGWQPEEALMRLSFLLSRAESSNGLPRAAASGVGEASLRPVPANGPSSGAGKLDVVIADDDPIVQSRVRITLEEYGMTCMMATNGTAALQMIRDHRPRAAVLDVNMPGMDGYLVLAAIREERLPVRVVMLTARRHENEISRGFTLGADDYIVKPFNGVELVARVKRLLRN